MISMHDPGGDGHASEDIIIVQAPVEQRATDVSRHDGVVPHHLVVIVSGNFAVRQRLQEGFDAGDPFFRLFGQEPGKQIMEQSSGQRAGSLGADL